MRNKAESTKGKTMDDATKKMILEWLEKDGGDKERLAKWMARNLPFGIRQCRAFIAEATA